MTLADIVCGLPLDHPARTEYERPRHARPGEFAKLRALMHEICGGTRDKDTLWDVRAVRAPGQDRPPQGAGPGPGRAP